MVMSVSIAAPILKENIRDHTGQGVQNAEVRMSAIRFSAVHGIHRIPTATVRTAGIPGAGPIMALSLSGPNSCCGLPDGFSSSPFRSLLSFSEPNRFRLRFGTS